MITDGRHDRRTAHFDLGLLGKKVVLIERNPTLGGVLGQPSEDAAQRSRDAVLDSHHGEHTFDSHVVGRSAIADLAGEIGRIAASGKSVFSAAGAALAFLQGYGRGIDRDVGPWLADAVVADGLGWAHAVPLSAARPPERAEKPSTGRDASHPRLLAGYAGGALKAIDLSADLGRRADRLLAIAPKLRAKGAAAVNEKQLSGDALAASQPIAGISDRGLRRLFERLDQLGAVRELSGRATFRLYGL